ncbi:hypothetical protein C8R45DRAFT_1029155 [Mycena sanguinolenta]|nr:hypothetical protein C8R45DRAFT_1029155 [Mycena sanguinolenta]
MVQCNAAACAQEGKNQCTRCKQRFYCGAGCQQKDWPSHKKECKRPTSPPPSPYGQTFDVFTRLTKPISDTAIFFDSIFGYSSASPENVYKDLVNAYRMLRLGAHRNADRVPSALQEIDFKGWMERIARAQVLPEWWNAEVNGAGLEAYTSQDTWGRLDRTVTRAEIEGNAQKRMFSLGMMIEKVLNSN